MNVNYFVLIYPESIMGKNNKMFFKDQKEFGQKLGEERRKKINVMPKVCLDGQKEWIPYSKFTKLQKDELLK